MSNDSIDKNFERLNELLKERDILPHIRIQLQSSLPESLYGELKQRSDSYQSKFEPTQEEIDEALRILSEPRILWTSNKNNEKIIDYHSTANEFKERLHIYFLKDRKNRSIIDCYYDLNSGFYRTEGVKDIINIMVEKLLQSNQATTNLKNEFYAHIRDLGFEYLDKWTSKGSKHIIVNNGVINLDKYLNGEPCLEAWSPDFHSFNKLDVEFDERNAGDLFRNHIELVIPDHTDREAFQKFVGSFLETDNYAHQKIFILYGKEGSGKTVTLRLFAKFFGIDNIATKSFQQLAEDKFAMADLAFRMANICEELPQSAIKQIEKLNSLTGGLVDGQRKNRDPFAFFQNAKIGAACNDLPKLSGDTTTIRAFMSRVIMITFNLVIRGTRREIQQYDDVMLEQKSGILNWVLEGYKKYREDNRKIKSTRSTEETLEYYIANSDFMAYFINGCLVQGDLESDYVIKEELYQAYLKAARTKNAVTVTPQTFKQNFPMKFTLGTVKSERIKVSGKQEHVFKGVLLRPERSWFRDIEDEDSPNEQSGPKVGNLGNYEAPLPELPTMGEHRATLRKETTSKVYIVMDQFEHNGKVYKIGDMLTLDPDSEETKRYDCERKIAVTREKLP